MSVAGNIKSGVSIFGVDGTLEEADTQAEDAIVSGTIANYTKKYFHFKRRL